MSATPTAVYIATGDSGWEGETMTCTGGWLLGCCETMAEAVVGGRDGAIADKVGLDVCAQTEEAKASNALVVINHFT